MMDAGISEEEKERDMRDTTAGSARKASITLGVLLIILGVVAMMVPLFTALMLIKLMGWLLIFAAIQQAIHAYRSRHEGGTFFKILLVVLYAVAGAMLLRRPVSGAIAATAIIGILFLLDGVMEIALGLQVRRERGKSEWLFAGGLMSFVFGGIILYKFPVSAVWTIGLLIGIRLIFKGIEQIVRSTAGTRADIERRAA